MPTPEVANDFRHLGDDSESISDCAKAQNLFSFSSNANNWALQSIDAERCDGMEARKYLSKVPQVTIFFWVIKVLCTTVGETASDFFNESLGIGLVGTSIGAGVLLAVSLFFQFRAKTYQAGIYWVTVVLISVFGTLVTDNLTDGMGVPLEFSTILFTVLLVGTFISWYAAERELSVHRINTTRREIFYWLTILFTFALGTATGDLVSEALGFGYLPTALMVAAFIAVVAVAWKVGLDGVLSFWLIYIMTRPLGASVGDYLSQGPEVGGLGLGATVTSVIFLLLILATIIYLAASKYDTVIREEKVRQTRHRFVQVATACVLLVAGSLYGYYSRNNYLIAHGPGQITQEDLQEFKSIEQDILLLVEQNDFGGAKVRVKDLEVAWDAEDARLKRADKERWLEIDASLDEIFGAVRSKTPNQGAAKTAIEDALAKIG